MSRQIAYVRNNLYASLFFQLFLLDEANRINLNNYLTEICIMQPVTFWQVYTNWQVYSK